MINKAIVHFEFYELCRKKNINFNGREPPKELILNYRLKATMSDENKLDVIRCIAVFRFLMTKTAKKNKTDTEWNELAENNPIPSGIKLHIFCELCNVLGIKLHCKNFSDLLLAILQYLIDIAVKTNKLTVDQKNQKNMERCFPDKTNEIRIDKDFALETLKSHEMSIFQYRCLLIRAMVSNRVNAFCTRALFMVLKHAHEIDTFDIHKHMGQTNYTQEQFNGTTVVRGDVSSSNTEVEEECSRKRHAITPKEILNKQSDTLRRSAFNQKKYPNYVRLTEVVRDFYFRETDVPLPLPSPVQPAKKSCTLDYFREHAIDGVAHCLGGLALIDLSSTLQTVKYKEFHQSHMNFDVPEFFTGQKAPLGILVPYFIGQQKKIGGGTIYKYVFENVGEKITFMSVFNLKLDKTFQRSYNSDMVTCTMVDNQCTATTPDSPTEYIKHFFDMKYVVDKDYRELPTMWTYEVQTDAVAALQNKFKTMKNVIRQIVVAQRQPITNIRKAFNNIELHENVSIHKGIQRYIRHSNPFFDSIGFVLPHKVAITSAKQHEKHNRYYGWYQRSCELEWKKSSKQHRQTLVNNELPPEFLQEVSNNIKTAIVNEVYRCTAQVKEFKRTNIQGIRSFFSDVSNDSSRAIKNELMELLQEYPGEPIKAVINLLKSPPRCDSDRPYTYQYQELIHNTCVYMLGLAACGDGLLCLDGNTHNHALDQIEKTLAQRYTSKDGMMEQVANIVNSINPWHTTSAPEHLTATKAEISQTMASLRNKKKTIIEPKTFCNTFESMTGKEDTLTVFQNFDTLTSELLHHVQTQPAIVIQGLPDLNWEDVAKEVFLKSNEPSLVWAEWNWIVYERAKRIFNVAETMQKEFQQHCTEIHRYGFTDIYEYLCMKAYKLLTQNEREMGQWHSSKRMSNTELKKIKEQLGRVETYLEEVPAGKPKPQTPDIGGIKIKEDIDRVVNMFADLNAVLEARHSKKENLLKVTTLYQQMSAMNNSILANEEYPHNRTSSETMSMVPDIAKEKSATELINVIATAVNAYYEPNSKNSKSVEIFYDPPKSIVQVNSVYYDVHETFRTFDGTFDKDPTTVYNEQKAKFEKFIATDQTLHQRKEEVEHLVNMCLAYGMKMMPSGYIPEAFSYNFETHTMNTDEKDKGTFTVYMTMKTLANVAFWPNYYDCKTATVTNTRGESHRALKATQTFYSRHEFQELRKLIRFSGLKDPVESVLYILQALEAERHCVDLNESVLQESAQRVMSDIDNYLQKTKELLNPIPTADALTLCVHYQEIYEKGDLIENALLSNTSAKEENERKNEEVNKRMVKKLTKEHYGSMCKRLIKYLPNEKHQTYITFDDAKHELFCMKHKGGTLLYDKHEETLSHVLVFVDLKLPNTVFVMQGSKCADKEAILRKKDLHYTISPMLYALITKPILEQKCEKIKMQRAYRTADIEVALRALQSFPPLPELIPLECDICAQTKQIDKPEIRNVTKPREASLRPPLFPIA